MSSQEEASDPWGIPLDEKPPQPSADTSPSPLAPETPPAEPKPPFSQVLAAAQSVFGGRGQKGGDRAPPPPPRPRLPPVRGGGRGAFGGPPKKPPPPPPPPPPLFVSRRLFFRDR